MASRAEARRRKILENSEQRLQRLTGRLDTAELKKEELDKFSTNTSEESHLEKRDVSKEQGESREQTPVLSLEERAVGDGDAVSPASQVVSPETRDNKLTDEEDCKSQTNVSKSPLRFRRVPVSSQPPTPSDEGSLTQEGKLSNEQSSEYIRQIELTRLISCVVVAIVVRVLLPSLLGYLVLKSAAIMFIVMEGALFTLQKHLLQKVVLPHKSNLMAGALLMCGIKPDLIQTYNRIMGIASAVFEDLMLYFFTFITCHLIVS